MKNRIKNSKTISNIKEIGEDGLIHLKTGEVASLIEVKAIELIGDIEYKNNKKRNRKK